MSKAQALAGCSCRCNGLVHSAVFPTRRISAVAAVALPAVPAVPAASVLNTLKIFEEFYMELQLVQACSKPPGSLQRFLVGEFMRDTRHAVTSCRTLVIPGSYLISFVWIFVGCILRSKAGKADEA